MVLRKNIKSQNYTKVFIIAEAGVNHNGEISRAERLIQAAKSAGADAVKFQTFDADKLVTKNALKAHYQKEHDPVKETQWKMLKRLELPKDAYRSLMNRCNELDILFLSTAFDESSADFLDDLGMSIFKIPSGEITNLPLVECIAKKKRPIFMSTGMANLEEIGRAVDVIKRQGNKSITLLHCVTEYPAPIQEANLRAMETLKKTFDLPVGYSDHTIGPEAAFASVAMGATVIEKHLTLDRSLPGPDHQASSEPFEFQKMVEGIRKIELALGSGEKNPQPCELKNIDVARKSLVAARDLKMGTKLTKEDLICKRPGHGISPAEFQKVVGARVKVFIKRDSVLNWYDLDV